MKPIFVLGLGAQKAGTSWLHSTLAKNKNVNMGFVKEYHIWDAVYCGLTKNFKVPVKKPDNANAAMRRLMQTDPDVYIKYFKGLITSDVHVTGDITPSYSILGKADLTEISRIIETDGFDLKVVFLMRDPIERMWSAVRMEERNRRNKGHQLEKNFAETRVREYLKMDGNLARSDYKSTVQNIESVFRGDQFHFEFYENLFSDSSIERLASFLGFSIDNVNFDQRVNASPSIVRSEATTEEMAQTLKPQYQFCNERFPETRSIWTSIA